jgi:hypothetical protein
MHQCRRPFAGGVPSQYLNTFGARGQSTTCCTAREQLCISVGRTTTYCGQSRRKTHHQLFQDSLKAVLGGRFRLLLVTFVVYRSVVKGQMICGESRREHGECEEGTYEGKW